MCALASYSTTGSSAYPPLEYLGTSGLAAERSQVTWAWAAGASTVQATSQAATRTSDLAKRALAATCAHAERSDIGSPVRDHGPTAALIPARAQAKRARSTERSIGTRNVHEPMVYSDSTRSRGCPARARLAGSLGWSPWAKWLVPHFGSRAGATRGRSGLEFPNDGRYERGIRGCAV